MHIIGRPFHLLVGLVALNRTRLSYAVIAVVCVALTSPFLAAAEPTQRELLETFQREFVVIQPGTEKFPATFSMGSDSGGPAERPVKQVTLSQPFAIAKYEVPQNLYESVMGENPSRWKGPRNSVEMMTWSEARQFCERVTKLMREAELLAADEVIRLPTEIEWEYCCRAGTTTAYSFGDTIRKESDVGPKNSILDEFAWYTGNAAGNDPPVGALKPNPWGLYDMHGYLWEFTADDWSLSHAEKEADPQQITLKSGSWKDPAGRLTSAARRAFSKTEKDDAVGFRCVRSKISTP
ncbi:SUMF1/EgtB/PvdO family nonheme iron enzyme [bacterium]|nr:SUMF1/EgtB/PvdO family nonheme iron enzyme [bacterium]